MTDGISNRAPFGGACSAEKRHSSGENLHKSGEEASRVAGEEGEKERGKEDRNQRNVRSVASKMIPVRHLALMDLVERFFIQDIVWCKGCDRGDAEQRSRTEKTVMRDTLASVSL